MFHFSSLRPSKLIAVTGLVSALALGAFAAPAATLAKGGAPVISVKGTCSIHSTARLKAKHDGSRIEVEFEVDQNRNNRTWNVRLWDDGHRVFAGARKTLAPSGSFTVRRLIPNRAGLDTIVARAVNITTGESCRATLKV
ncbi:MAG TPA: hypothetical protein VF323_00240 [Candidatus Limnocylindrales bacterium]